MKIEIFKIKKNFKKGGFHTNPNISWEIILYMAFAMILLSFIFGFYLFTQINQEPVLPATNGDSQVPTINLDRLKKALNYFSDREERSAEILGSPAPVVDPSI